METFQIIIVCLLGSIILLILTIKFPFKFKESYSEEPLLSSPGNTVVSAASSLDDAAKRAAEFFKFIPGAGGANYSPDKTIRMFPNPSQTWLLDYQTHMRKAVIKALDTLLMPPNTLCIFTAPNFGGNIVIVPYGHLSLSGATAVFTNKEQGHIILFKEILKFTRPVGGNGFSCVVPTGFKVEIGFENGAPTLKLPEGAHASLTAPAPFANISISKV
jgi:hypothetical protein